MIGIYRFDNNLLVVCGFEFLLLDIMMQFLELRWFEDVWIVV